MEPPEQHLGLAEAVFACSDAPSDATNYVQFQDRVPRSPPLRRDAGPDVYTPRPWKALGPVESDAYSLWSAESIAIPLTYMYTGLLLSFPTAYMEYFPRQLGASDAQLSTISVVRALPWTFKVLFGVLPDNLPLRGQRFKPYLLLGCGISSFFHALLCISSDSLSVVSFTLLLLGAMVGIVMADVMSDALVAFRVLRKLEQVPGRTQSTVYMCRFLSEMVGYWAGALLSNRDRWGVGVSMGQQFGFLAVFPLLTVVPSIWAMAEPSVSAVAPVRQQVDALWVMLQRRATWQPVCFLVLANSCFVHNAAWGNYLKVAFHFDAFQYGAMAAVGASVTFASIYCYRELVVPHFSAPWHWVYLITGVVVAVFSTLNVLLVLGVNDALGVSPFWFAVGDDAVVSFARGFQYLPLAVMFVAVCPENQEGVAFALLTSITNLAHAFANTVSNMLLHLWPVELADLEAGHFSGVWKLSVLTSIIPLLPLLLTTRLLPRGSQDHAAMMHETSRRWGIVVVCFYAFGFVWVLALSLLAVIQPCHFLVGGGGCDSPTSSTSP